MECIEVGLTVDRREENGGGLEADVGGGLDVLFIEGSSVGEEGGGPCCKVTINHCVKCSLSTHSTL